MAKTKYSDDELESIIQNAANNKIQKASVILNDLYEIVNHGMIEKLITTISSQDLTRSDKIKSLDLIKKLSKQVDLDIKEFSDTPLSVKTKMFRVAEFFDIQKDTLSKSSENNILLSFRKTRITGFEIASGIESSGKNSKDLEKFINLTTPARNNFKTKHKAFISDIFSVINKHKAELEKAKNKIKVGA
ncbi:hypothetical protein N0614_09540 [Pseudomonas aeruginosa]|nr:hypothetical protein [Pseudomonas aeruginosa]